jgi:vancomycin resistance protein YoaR
VNRDSELVPLTQELPSAQPVRSGRILLWAAAAVLTFAGGGLAAAALLPVSEEVPADTYVGGLPMGGLDRSQVRTAIAGPLATKVAAPVRLLLADEVVEVNPATAGITLNRTATEKALFEDAPESVLDRFWDRRSGERHDVPVVLAVKQSALEKTIKARLGTFNRAAKDATIDVPAPSATLTEKGDAAFSATEAKATVVPAQTGRRVEAKAAIAGFRNAVATLSPQLRLPVAQTQPKVSTAQASEVDQLIGTFTTAHACCEPRVKNIHRIAELVDGSVFAPGTTFSLNAASGPRTAEKGFVSAPAIADGELVDQFGGGVSQFSTTLFNAAWFAGLPILTHQPHSKYISRYPPGREATLDFDTIDLKVRNDTDSPVVIRTFTTDTSVTVALYGHTGDRKVESTTGERVPRTGGGFSITVRRVVLDSGSAHRRDTLNWAYAELD